MLAGNVNRISIYSLLSSLSSLLWLPVAFIIANKKAFYSGLSRSRRSNVYANKKALASELPSLSKEVIKKE